MRKTVENEEDCDTFTYKITYLPCGQLLYGVPPLRPLTCEQQKMLFKTNMLFKIRMILGTLLNRKAVNRVVIIGLYSPEVDIKVGEKHPRY